MAQEPVAEDQPSALAWLSACNDLASETIRHYLELTKPRIALLIVISTAVGYCYGTGLRFSLLTLFNTLLGTALLAASSATLNQWYERELDAKMGRTRTRPIPAGDISAGSALAFGIGLGITGALDLGLFTNILAAALGVATWAGYLFLYTPLKRLHPICTTIGALPGAMPPLIGFAAACGHLNIDAWVLFGILFLWQFPHFHAIAWMYRDEYKAAGIKMLTVVAPYGRALPIEIMTTLVLLVPISLAPTFLHMTGSVYFGAALALDLAFLYFGVRMAKGRGREHARRLLLASVIYVPLLFAFLVFDSPRFAL